MAVRPRPSSNELHVRIDGDEQAAAEQLLAWGWTDGLPIVVPTVERVDWMCAGAVHAPDDALGHLAPRGAPLSLRHLAANAVMAGCLPEYMPVLEAAVAAMQEGMFNLFGMQTTTHPCALLVIVHGELAERIGMNSGAGCFGPGNRANATIGRALRLVMMNVGGALPGETDRATQGSPAKYTWCFAENEAASPWPPYRRLFGLGDGESAVTVAAVEGPHNVNDHGSDSGADILRTIAGTMATVGSNTLYRGGDHFVVLGPEHAAVIANSGFSREDAQAFLYEHARVPVDRIPPKKLEEAAGWGDYAGQLEEWGGRIPLARAPEEIRLLVAGGPGKHSAWIPTFGPTYSQTRRIETAPAAAAGVRVVASEAARVTAPAAPAAPTAAASPRRGGLESVVIIGSGPAGLTAALYAARANLAPLVIEGMPPGGLLQETEVVENFPGYPDGAQGPQVIADLRRQAERFGARYARGEVTRVELAPAVGGVHRLWIGDDELRARTLILAMGAQPKRLGVPGEEALRGRGIAFCAVCDAPLFKGRRTLVVGGGDSAMEEALGLARHAAAVTLVHRREHFRASPILLQRVRDEAAVAPLTPYVVEAFLPGADGTLAAARLRRADGDEVRECAVDGAFIAIGHEPHSALVSGQVALDADGYVVTEGGTTATGTPGVFACGDLVDRRYRQAVTAAASGCQAALDAQRYLEQLAPS
ncbi:MAG TPA: FAD-dependent oxidoreductase [Candidatus Dormibacteraeota bacterium]|nr:FAD-dependent oxidoreductase [Candidatus Dormibacteraeota bacterium]